MGGPRLYTIPAHRAFADALATGLIRRFGGDRMALARGIVLVPNNRGALAVNVWASRFDMAPTTVSDVSTRMTMSLSIKSSCDTATRYGMHEKCQP